MSPQIVLLRHGKAESHGSRDIDRVLAPRGREDAVRLGAWLGARGLRAPVRAYVSDAARARQTWDLVLAGLGELDVDSVVTEDLYDAGTDTVLELVRGTPAAVQTVVVVGHNPTMTDVAWSLTETASQAGAELRRRGLPTAGCAVVQVDGWDDPCGVLAAFATPDDY